jgi:hypothetical protein
LEPLAGVREGLDRAQPVGVVESMLCMLSSAVPDAEASVREENGSPLPQGLPLLQVPPPQPHRRTLPVAVHLVRRGNRPCRAPRNVCSVLQLSVMDARAPLWKGVCWWNQDRFQKLYALRLCFRELILLCQAMLLSGREEAEAGHERGGCLQESLVHGGPIGSEGTQARPLPSSQHTHLRTRSMCM